MQREGATLPWHVLGLQMVPTGHAKNGAGDEVGLQQLSVVTACTAEPQSPRWALAGGTLHSQSPTAPPPCTRLCLPRPITHTQPHHDRANACVECLRTTYFSGWVPLHSKGFESLNISDSGRDPCSLEATLPTRKILGTPKTSERTWALPQRFKGFSLPGRKFQKRNTSAYFLYI